MPAYEGVIDWQKHRVPIMVGLIGLILVALDNMILGFLMLVVALLFGAYNSDASMEGKDTW